MKPLEFLLLISSCYGYKLPSMPKPFQASLARIVSSAVVGAGLATGFLPSITDMVLEQNSFIVHAAAAKSVFEGQYNDPNHPGCLRKITVKNGLVTIIGSDELDGSKQWIIQAKEDFPGTIFVDFSPKGGPSDLLGTS